MQRPPCSYFGKEGSGDITAAAAAKDGDCSLEPMRQQQQETFDLGDDLLEQQAAEVEATSAQRQRQAEAAAAGAHGARRPPGEQSAGQGIPEKQQQQEQQQHGADKEQANGQVQHAQNTSTQASGKPAGISSEQQQPQQEQQRQADAAGTVVMPGIRGGNSDAVEPASGGSSSLSSVAIGMLVAAVAVLSLGFAVALLQPATRDRIRGLFGSSR